MDETQEIDKVSTDEIISDISTIWSGLTYVIFHSRLDGKLTPPNYSSITTEIDTIKIGLISIQQSIVNPNLDINLILQSLDGIKKTIQFLLNSKNSPLKDNVVLSDMIIYLDHLSNKLLLLNTQYDENTPEFTPIKKTKAHSSSGMSPTVVESSTPVTNRGTLTPTRIATWTPTLPRNSPQFHVYTPPAQVDFQSQKLDIEPEGEGETPLQNKFNRHIDYSLLKAISTTLYHM